MNQISLADRAVHALALIRQMEDGVRSSDEHRHIVWTLRDAAEETIANACREVIRLSDVAREVKRAADQQEAGDAQT